MPELPLVSALMAAYNAERYIAEALHSALAQDWPADRLEIIVVDDGSTDETAAVVQEIADRHPGRIRLIRQANGGVCSAVNTAFHAASGELLALLDADDAWPAGKLRAQTALLAERPGVGLVYGDMRVVDADGRVIHESFLEGEPLPEGACLAEALFSNDCTASSILFRRSLAEPIPADVPYTDWWFAVLAASRAELAYQPEPRTLYRFHGANLTLGTEGAARERELRKAIQFRRWFLRRLEPGAIAVQDLATVWRANDRNALELLEAGAPFLDLTDADRADAQEWVMAGVTALRRGEAALAAAHFSRAAACDLLSEPARDGLAAALAAAPGGEGRPGQTPLAGAAARVVLAFADELLESPALLDDYVEKMTGVADTTLAIDASAVTESELETIAARVPDDLDVLAVLGPLDAIGRARLTAGTYALLSERDHGLALPRL